MQSDTEIVCGNAGSVVATPHKSVPHEVKMGLYLESVQTVWPAESYQYWLGTKNTSLSDAKEILNQFLATMSDKLADHIMKNVHSYASSLTKIHVTVSPTIYCYGSHINHVMIVREGYQYGVELFEIEENVEFNRQIRELYTK